MKMTAAVLDKQGTPITVYDDVEIIEPRAGEIRVRVRYCSLCKSDESVISGVMGPLAEPIIVGHEAAGVVESVGAGVTHLAPGDHVVLTPVPPCGHCYHCQRGQASLCANGAGIYTNALPDGSTGLSHRGRRVLRGVGMGALAQYVVAPASGAVKIGAELPLDVACVIACAVQTGAGAVLNTAGVEAGASVLVTGLGGVGMATIQGARIAGATTIIASDPVASRREVAAELGATDLVDPQREDLAGKVMALTGGIGVDYAFETAGQAELVKQGIAVTRAGGTTVCVGAPSIDQHLTLEHFVIFAASEKKLCGCLLGSSNSLEMIPRLVRLWQQGRLDLARMVTTRRPLSEVNEAFADLKAGRGIRTVLEIP